MSDLCALKTSDSRVPTISQRRIHQSIFIKEYEWHLLVSTVSFCLRTLIDLERCKWCTLESGTKIVTNYYHKTPPEIFSGAVGVVNHILY